MKLTAIVKGPEQEGGGTGVRIKISSKGDSKSLKSENTARQKDDLLDLSGVGTCNTLEQWCKSLNPSSPVKCNAESHPINSLPFANQGYRIITIQIKSNPGFYVCPG